MNDARAFTADDESHMRRALALAAEAIGLSDPNPRVGCVIVGDGWTVEGHTQAAGQAHAEVMALRMAHERGHALAGATAYVTLEPCAHHGRTPPCCDALIAAGLARVIVALGDPHPQVAGEGLRRLRAAGIAVQTGLLADESRELNIGFLSRIERGRPFVRLKAACSLDGRSALEDGRSQWITGPAARADGHRWRKRAGAVLSGIGTVLADDPRLDVREVPTARQPWRVIVDASLQTPPAARVLDAPGQALVIAARDDGPAADALRARGAEVLALPAPQGRIDLRALLALLGERGVNELHVEAGPTLNAALLASGLVDELLVYQAPMLIGPGRAMAALPPLPGLDAAARFHYIDVARIGHDLRLRARPISPSEHSQ
jgi:diaminohydroxyphosphoribosylaminopyrimidine deaminase / 5-amino-6-(5-phosphoribosylamino)uracil reductase